MMSVNELIKKYGLERDFESAEDAMILEKYGDAPVVARFVVPGNIRVRRGTSKTIYMDSGKRYSPIFYAFIFRSKRKYMAYINGIREHVPYVWSIINKVQHEGIDIFVDEDDERLPRYAFMESV